MNKNKLDEKLFRFATRAGAMNDAVQLVRDCNGDPARIRQEIDKERHRIQTSTRPEHQPGASPRQFLEEYIDALERMLKELVESEDAVTTSA